MSQDVGFEAIEERRDSDCSPCEACPIKKKCGRTACPLWRGWFSARWREMQKLFGVENDTETETKPRSPLAYSLCHARIMADMTQTELSLRCGLSRGMIQQYESGRSVPSYRTLCVVADALNIPVKNLCEAQSEENEKSFMQGGQIAWQSQRRSVPK